MIGTSIGNSLIWDNGTNVGIGNTNTSYTLDVSGTGRFTGALTGTSATFSGLITSTAASDILTATSSNTAYKWIYLANTGGSLVVGINNSAGGATITTAAYASNIFTRNATDLVFGTNDTARLTIASTGAATFSSTVQAYSKVFIQRAAGGADTLIQFKNEVGTDKAKILFGGTNEELSFYAGTGATENMRITSGGNVVIGDTAAIGNAPLGVKSTSAGQQPISSWNTATSGTIYFMEFGSGATYVARGSITYNGTITAYNSTSDYRLKEDLKEYNGLEIISKLKTYDYKWKESGVRDYGMIAHELQEILPNYVSGEKDSIDENGNIRYQGVDYSKVVPILVKAIQELSAQNQDLKSRLDKAGL